MRTTGARASVAATELVGSSGPEYGEGLYSVGDYSPTDRFQAASTSPAQPNRPASDHGSAG